MDYQSRAWIVGVLGFALGAVISWVVARGRGRSEVTQAEALAAKIVTQAQVDLAGAYVRADRVPVLERDLANARETLNRINAENSTLHEQVRRLPEIQERLGASEHTLGSVNRALADLREQSGKINAELAAERQTIATLRADLDSVTGRYEVKLAEATSLALDLANVRHKLATEIEGSQEKLALLTDAKQTLFDQFKNLANDILEDKSKRFTEQNQVNLGALLDPLRLRINEFQSKIEDTYIKEGKERTAPRWAANFLHLWAGQTPPP